MRSTTGLWAGVILGFSLVTAPVSAETNKWGQTTLGGTPRRNVDTAGARAPGTMVNLGVARGQLASLAAQTPIEITDPVSTEPEPRHVFFSDAIEILFEQLNTTLLYFENLLRARAGLTPRVPDVPDDGGITGVVLSSRDGSGIDAVAITLFDENNEEVASTTTDADGSYTLTGLPTGIYRVEVAADGFADERLTEIEVVAGETTDGIDFELDRAR